MYTSFHIKNYRCFDNLALTDLAQVNLIGGKNNVGKTALLEALFLHTRGYNPQFIFDLDVVRGLTPNLEQPVPEWEFLFLNRDSSLTVELLGEDAKTGSRSLKLRFVEDSEERDKIKLIIPKSRFSNGAAILSPTSTILALDYRQSTQANTVYLAQGGEILSAPPDSPFPSFLIPAQGRPLLKETRERFSNLVRNGKLLLLLEYLQRIDPRIRDIQLLDFGGETMPHGFIFNERPIPLNYMGEGINRVVNFILTIASASGGVVLVDEIENGLHYSVLADVWKAIAQAARTFNVQVFATTHSLEMIRAAHETFSQSEPYDFRLHRLDQNIETGQIETLTFNQNSMNAAILFDQEVRG
nr:AAA family ATPase [Nitrosomonas nitrosa]